MMGMKLLERSDRYLRMFKLTTAMEAKLKEVKRFEHQVDILSSADGDELRDNCDLIKFYMDSVEALICEIKDITYKMNETVNVTDIVRDQNIMDIKDDGLDGIEMSDDEIDEMVKSLKFNKVKCLSLRTKSVCVEDEHESC